MSEYNEYILEKFCVALNEVCIPENAENYEFDGRTDELNFCVLALIAMVDED